MAERTRSLSENVAMIVQLRDKERPVPRACWTPSRACGHRSRRRRLIATDRGGIVTGLESRGRPASRPAGRRGASAASASTASSRAPRCRCWRSDNTEPPHPVDGLSMADVALAPGIRALFAQADAGLTVDGDIEVVTAAGIHGSGARDRQPAQGRRPVRSRLSVRPRPDETRAVEVARMKDEFVGMISHELRTPLSAIIGFLDLLQNDPAQAAHRRSAGVRRHHRAQRAASAQPRRRSALHRSGRIRTIPARARGGRRRRAGPVGRWRRPARTRSERESSSWRRSSPGTVPVFIDAGRGGAGHRQPALQRHQVHPARGHGHRPRARGRRRRGVLDRRHRGRHPRRRTGDALHPLLPRIDRDAQCGAGGGARSHDHPRDRPGARRGRWRSRARRAWERSSASPCRQLPAPRC